MKSRYGFFTVAVLTIVMIFTQSLLSQTEFSSHFAKHIKFVSEPPHYGQAGVAYSYTAQAVDNDTNAVIRYYAGTFNPVGFTIDSISGAVNWTPASKGWYSLSITAVSSESNIAVQFFIVTVIGRQRNCTRTSNSRYIW